MDHSELAFIEKKEAGERAQYYRFFRLAMLLSFICPFIIAWFQAIEGAEDPFSIRMYFIGVLILLALSGTGIYVSYRRNLKKMQDDLSHRIKVIERTRITRKQFMPQNNTYYFYIDSAVKLSIEVAQEDYHRLDQGDELNIEYAARSLIYLGYF